MRRARSPNQHSWDNKLSRPPGVKLNARKVMEARYDRMYLKLSWAQLGIKYGVWEGTIRAAVNGVTWRHV